MKDLVKSRLFLAGLITLVIGASPLLLYILYEYLTGSTGGNPVGLGLLFFVTFWPAVIMMGLGALSVLRRRGGQ